MATVKTETARTIPRAPVCSAAAISFSGADMTVLETVPRVVAASSAR